MCGQVSSQVLWVSYIRIASNSNQQVDRKNNFELLNVGWNDFKDRLMKEYNSNQPKFSIILVAEIFIPYI